MIADLQQQYPQTAEEQATVIIDAAFQEIQCTQRQRWQNLRIFEVVDAIKTVPYVQMIHIDEATATATWALCKGRPDKAWSLVDCTSFVLMQQLSIQEALTTDQHFEQAGFMPLLK